MFGLMTDASEPARAVRVAVVTANDGTRWAAWPEGSAAYAGTAQDMPRAAAVAAGAAAPSDQVRTPCAGTLASIDVAMGAQVEVGTQVATLEAMKMEFALLAAVSGTVQSLPVAAGAALPKGALVAQLSPDRGSKR